MYRAKIRQYFLELRSMAEEFEEKEANQGNAGIQIDT